MAGALHRLVWLDPDEGDDAIAEEEDLVDREDQERPERKPRLEEALFGLGPERILLEDRLRLFVAGGGVTGELFAFGADRFGLFDLALRDHERDAGDAALNRSAEENDRDAQPTEPRAREHQELRVAEPHALAPADS